MLFLVMAGGAAASSGVIAGGSPPGARRVRLATSRGDEAAEVAAFKQQEVGPLLAPNAGTSAQLAA